MAIHLAAAFDANYLPRALAMHASAVKYLPEAQFWFLCLDEESLNLLKTLNLKNVRTQLLADMGDSELMAVRKDRNPIEFAMTAKPAWIAHLMNSSNIKNGDQLTLIDADIMFYADPADLLRRIAQHSITITPHKFSKKKEYLGELSGIYNSGLIFFTKDANSIRCANEWRAQCIDWCYLHREPGRHTDQRYVNDWPKKYHGVYELPDKGVNTGTWNVLNFNVSGSGDSFMIDADPLICYHFHGLKAYEGRSAAIRFYPLSVYNDAIYAKYASALQTAYSTVRSIRPGFSGGLAPRLSFLRQIKQTVQKLLRNS